MERAELKISQLKIAITVTGCDAVFREKGRTDSRSVRNSMNGTQGKVLFSQEKDKLKSPKSAIFPKKRKLKSPGQLYR